jgi:MoaA/NifB/PqqE/SkfB family radical SAM enzyme
MDFGSLARLGIKHVKNHAAQSIYLHSGMNWTSPTTFCGLVTHQCNLYCGFCYDRKDVDPTKEMSFDEWRRALLSVKELAGEYFISFSGGEVMLMKWFPDLLQFCADNGIKGGVLTNGTAINDKTAPRLIGANPFELSLSIDGPTAEIHDRVRGRKGSFDMVCRAVSLFRKERDRQGKSFPIIVRCVINRINLAGLPAMVDLVKEIGATAIVFQPVQEITDKVMFDWQRITSAATDSLRDNFWIAEDQWEELDRVTETLMTLKKAGAPIMSTERELKLFAYHFRGEKPSEMSRTCTVSLRNFFIQPNGDVQFCHDWPPIGNLRQQGAKDIWFGEHAESLRQKSLSCEKQCLVNCSAQRTLIEKASMALHLLRN